MSDPFDPRRRTPDPRTPRASDRYASGRAPGPETPTGAGMPPAADPIEARLEQYARATDVQPAPDLSRRIAARLAKEPARTPPRRFLAALGAFDLGRARDAFVQMAGVALGRGRFPALVRAQALALVVLTLAAVGAAGVAGTAGVAELVRRVQDGPPVVVVEDPSPSRSPSALPSAPASPSARPSASPSPSGTPEPSETPEPAATREADDPHDLGGPADPAVRRTAEPTPRIRRTAEPDETEKATPRPRRTPRPTPKPTREPRRTERPETPAPDDDEPDEPDKTDEPDEPDAPDDEDDDSPGGGGSGSSGSVMAVGPLLLVWPA